MTLAGTMQQWAARVRLPWFGRAAARTRRMPAGLDKGGPPSGRAGSPDKASSPRR